MLPSHLDRSDDTDLDSPLTEWLQRYSAGDLEVAEVLFRQILPKLRELAKTQLGRERFAPALSSTELINEWWLRNERLVGWNIRNREHFYALTALAMRRALVDLARQRLAASRGRGIAPLSLDAESVGHPAANNNLERIVEIGQLMERLEKEDPVGARIVDLHYFAGYTYEEIAGLTGLNVNQVRHRWHKTQDWLKDRMSN
jgi:RNA polymerase sigma factor (TIGR02999 family)